MLLTTVDRALLYLEVNDNASNRLKLLDWITSISSKIETWLQRDIQLTSRTEYFDTVQNKREYFPKAIPIAASPAAVVSRDPLGQYTGGETVLVADDDYIFSGSMRSVVLLTPRDPAFRGLRLVYTGGLASVTARSVFATSTGSGTPAVGNYVQGQTSGSIGLLRAYAAGGAATIEVLAGIFEVEQVKCYPTVLLNNDPTITFNITSVTTRSLVESDPAIVKAAEIELRYMYAHKDDFENAMTGKEGTQRRPVMTHFSRLPFLQPEAEALLSNYKRVYIV